MKILLVEDDEDKRGHVTEYLREILPDADIAEARSMQSGLTAILEGYCDVVILDMTLPTFDISDGEDGGRPQAYGGREILRHMKHRGIRTRVIVLTQFDLFGEGADVLTLEELDAQLRASHSDHYGGAVYYNVASVDWRRDLEARLSCILTDLGEEIA